MDLKYILILMLFLNSGFVCAQPTHSVSHHQLQAQRARAGIERLETDELSKSVYKKIRGEVLARCSDVQLGAMDIWFGDSVVTWARVLLLDGDWLEARTILLGQAEVLQNIEKNLKANQIPVSTLSPVAGCRYILAETYRVEYEKTGKLDPTINALKHYCNVYIKYGPSPWGDAAQQKAEATCKEIERHGKQVRIRMGPHRAAFMAAQFKLGARLMKEEHFKKATTPLLNALTFFPESESSIKALRNLGICFIHLNRNEDALMTAEYICERLGAASDAPAAVFGIGRRYVDENDEMAAEIFATYLAAFPDGSHRANVLSHFAWKAYTTENWKETLAYFHALEAELRLRGESGESLEKAVYIQAECAKSIAAYDRFLLEFPSSKLVPRARVGLLTAVIEAHWFNRVEHELSHDEAFEARIYLDAGEMLLDAKEFRLAEQAFKLVLPATTRSRFSIATAQFGRARFLECVQTVEKLLADFPALPKFYDARLMQARAWVQLGEINTALVAYGEVVVGRPTYETIFEMAELISDPEDQLAAFQRIVLLANPDKMADRPFIARSIIASLPLCFSMQKYQVALDSCAQFEIIFPQHNQRPVIGKYREEAGHALAN